MFTDTSWAVYWLLRQVFPGPVVRLAWGPLVEGRHHLPQHGPLVIASNHLAALDPLFIQMAVPWRVVFTAKREYFTATGVFDRARLLFLRLTAMIPVDRAGGAAAQAAMSTALAVLDGGGIVGIFPEGTRARDGYVHRGHTGVARLALASGATIVPIAVLETDRIQPPGQVIPRLGWVRVRIGEPIAPTIGTNPRHLTDQTMRSLAVLAGRPYVDTYAGAEPW